MKESLLEVQHLSTHFQNGLEVVKAVDDVSFSLKKGETLGIVGESGSGKSVTSLSIMRLIEKPGQIKGGTIIFCPKERPEVDLVKANEQDLQHIRGRAISMIFQDPMTSLNPIMSCGSQLLEVLMHHFGYTKVKAREKVLEWFEKVKLRDPERIFKAYPHQLSGGQKQRVMIAMALSTEPDLLIADEPTTALDVTTQKEVVGLIQALKTEVQTSVMFISHDLALVGELADRVLVMNKGKILEEGPVHKIFKTPQHPYTKGLLACRPRLTPKLKRQLTITDFQGERAFTSVQEALKKLTLSEEAIASRNQKLQEQKPLLQVEHLRKWFPGRKNFFGKPLQYIQAVEDVSFKLFPGEVLGVVGESGSGKSTLGRCLVRLLTPDSGKIWFQDQEISNWKEMALKPLRQKIQLIFQDPYASLNPSMTVGQALVEPMEVYGIESNRKNRIDKAMHWLERVGLEAKHFNRYPGAFSGGQRQRLGIARALVLEPEFVVCDESVSSLDVSVQAQILNLLLDLREQLGLSYLFISHDLSVIQQISDRVLVMQQGRVVESGEVGRVYKNPNSSYTKQLIEAIPKGG